MTSLPVAGIEPELVTPATGVVSGSPDELITVDLIELAAARDLNLGLTRLRPTGYAGMMVPFRML